MSVEIGFVLGARRILSDPSRVTLSHGVYSRNSFPRKDGYSLMVQEVAPRIRNFPVYRVLLDFDRSLLSHAQISHIRALAVEKSPVQFRLPAILNRNVAPLQPVDEAYTTYATPVWPVVPVGWAGGALSWTGAVYVNHVLYTGPLTVNWQDGIFTFPAGVCGPNTIVSAKYEHHSVALIDTDTPTVWHEFDESGILALGLVVDPLWATTTYTVPVDL